jgi:uncharacterized protein
MKIAVVSDTHVKNCPEGFIEFIKEISKDTDMILHAGDYISCDSIKFLQQNYNFAGVYGNVDTNLPENLLNEKEIINIFKYRVGIFHGHGQNKGTFDRVYDKFMNDDVDVIVFGHSHQPSIVTKNGILYLNPGSPSNKRRERWFSYIMLTIWDECIWAELRFCSNNYLKRIT